MDRLNLSSISVFVIAVFPGLVSLHVYRLLMPARPVEWKDAVIQGLFYSVLNFFLLFPIAMFAADTAHAATALIRYWAAMGTTLFVGPIVWPFLLRGFFRRKWVRDRVNLPYPTAWDFFFETYQPAFMLVRLNNGRSIGGYFGPGSFAGSFPNDGDIYLESLYIMADDGAFTRPVDGTRGALIRKDQYECIELFEIPITNGEVTNVKA